MKGKAMREVILAQLGALRADAGVELIACKDQCVGDYLTPSPLPCRSMQMVEAKAPIETMAHLLRHEETRNMNLAESARLCSKDTMARLREGAAAGYMAASRVVTGVREANKS